MRHVALAFLVLSLILCLSCYSEPSATASTRDTYWTEENTWWVKHYAELNTRLDSEFSGDLSFSYRSGRDGSAEVTNRIFRLTDDGLGFVTSVPPQTFGISPDDAVAEVRVEFRDHDLDGFPDDFRFQGIDMHTVQAPYARFTDDDYVVLTDHVDYDVIYYWWAMGIAVSTNHVLYGKDTVMPPNQETARPQASTEGGSAAAIRTTGAKPRHRTKTMRQATNWGNEV